MKTGEENRRQVIKRVAAASFSAAVSLMQAQTDSSHEGTAEDSFR